MLPSMTSSPTWTTRPPSTLGSTVTCRPIGPAVDPAEHLGQPLLLGRGERRRRWSPGRPTGRGGGWPRRTAARSRSRRVPACGPVEHVAQQLLGDRADLARQQPVEQRRPCPRPGPSGRSRMRPSSRSPPTMRPNRNSSSSTLVELAAGVGGVQRRLGRQRHDAPRPGPIGRDQRCRATVSTRSRAARRHLATEQPAGQRGPVLGLARRVRQRPAQRELAVEQPRRRRTARRPGRAAPGRGARGLRGQPSWSSSRPAARVSAPGARAPGAPPGWRPPSAGAPVTAPPRRTRAMPSSSARNRSTVPLRRASSARDSPTTRPARSTASVPIWPRSSLTTCCRVAGQLLLAAGDDPGRLLLRLGPQLLEDLLPLGAGLVADLRGLVAGLGQLGAVLLQRRLRLGLHRLGPLDAALDRLAARAEDLLEARRDELREHEEDDREGDQADDDLAHGRDQRVVGSPRQGCSCSQCPCLSSRVRRRSGGIRCRR